MRRCFGLEPEAALKIRYKDDENDLCSITNNEELAMAIRKMTTVVVGQRWSA